MNKTLSARSLTLLLTICMALLVGNAYALDLHTAKAQGYVGEQANGLAQLLERSGRRGQFGILLLRNQTGERLDEPEHVSPNR